VVPVIRTVPGVPVITGRNQAASLPVLIRPARGRVTNLSAITASTPLLI